MFSNPMGYFQIGQGIGAANAPSMAGPQNVMDMFKAQQENQMKLAQTIGAFKAEKDYEWENDPQKKWFNNITNNMPGMTAGGPTTGATPGPGGFVLDTVGPGGPTFKNFGAEKAQKREEGINKGAGAESGKIALAQESIQNIQDMKKILFPDGTPNSFNRAAAAKSNMPIFGGALPFDEEGQTLYRKGGASLAARQLIQTGVAARPEETKGLYNQFMSNAFSNPAAAHKALDELENFYHSYLGTTDPSNMFHSDASGNIQRADVAADASTTAASGNQSSNMNPLQIASERKQAMNAIAKGAPRDKVAQEFKNSTGKDL